MPGCYCGRSVCSASSGKVHSLNCAVFSRVESPAGGTFRSSNRFPLTPSAFESQQLPLHSHGYNCDTWGASSRMTTDEGDFRQWRDRASARSFSTTPTLSRIAIQSPGYERRLSRSPTFRTSETKMEDFTSTADAAVVNRGRIWRVSGARLLVWNYGRRADLRTCAQRPHEASHGGAVGDRRREDSGAHDSVVAVTGRHRLQ